LVDTLFRYNRLHFYGSDPVLTNFISKRTICYIKWRCVTVDVFREIAHAVSVGQFIRLVAYALSCSSVDTLINLVLAYALSGFNMGHFIGVFTKTRFFYRVELFLRVAVARLPFYR